MSSDGGTSRAMRRSPWLLGVAALLPLTVARTPADAQDSPGSVHAGDFRPPLSPMILTRTLRRPLGDGHEVVASRSYEVRFVPDGDGYRIEGALIDVQVEAPAELDAFSALERARTDDGLFPMHVDRQGHFTSQARPDPHGAVRGSAELARAAVVQARLTGEETAQANAFIDVVRQRPARTEWPRDLFRPASGRQVAQREIPLADGIKGSVTVETDVTAQRQGGLLARFARTVTTDLGGDVNRTFEVWTLSPRS